MEDRLANGFAISLVMTVVAVAPRCMAASVLRLNLVIYDYAHVGPETLAATENKVSEIFGHANVQLIWRDGFAYAAERQKAENLAPEVAATLVIKLQPESEAARYGVKSVCGGIGFDSGAIVFVRSFDSRSTTSAPTRLSYVMAHELGHIMLGPNAHAIVGIMRATLLPEDWERAAQGTLGFTHSQNQQIGIWVAQRRHGVETMGSGARARARSHTGPDLQLTVKIYNSAHVSPGDLVEAEDRTASIFRQAKIKIIWDHVPMADEAHHLKKSEAWSPTDVHLRLWPRARVGPNTFGEDILGFCVSMEKSTAVIVFDEIRRRATIDFTTPGDLLGLVMAHELGHLLLGSKAHSTEGIMQARLPTDLRDRRRTLLVFTRRQAISLHGEVERRMRTQMERTRNSIHQPLTAIQAKALTDRLNVAEHNRFQFTPEQARLPANRDGAPVGIEVDLNIHLYNLAKVSSRTLNQATRDAAEVLATAGVNKVCWLFLDDSPEAHIVNQSVRPTSQPDSHADLRGYLVVIIEHGFPDNYLPDELGYALPDAQIGVNATVFSDRIERLHKSAVIDLPILLGHALAHEIGHVLLGTNKHSPTGLMKPRWSQADFQVARLKFMVFTASQRAEVQHRLSARQQNLSR